MICRSCFHHLQTFPAIFRKFRLCTGLLQDLSGDLTVDLHIFCDQDPPAGKIDGRDLHLAGGESFLQSFFQFIRLNRVFPAEVPAVSAARFFFQDPVEQGHHILAGNPDSVQILLQQFRIIVVMPDNLHIAENNMKRSPDIPGHLICLQQLRRAALFIAYPQQIIYSDPQNVCEFWKQYYIGIREIPLPF